MQLSDFPELILAVDTRDPTGARKKYLERAIATLDKGMEEGSIPNPDFLFAKETVNRSIEYAGQFFHKLYHSNFHEMYNDINNLSTSSKVKDFYLNFYPTAHLISGMIKRLKALPSYSLNAPILKLLEEILPLAEAVTFLKNKIVKRQPKSEEEKRAEKYTPPRSSSTAVGVVKAIFEEVVDKEYRNLLKLFTDRNLELLKNFSKALKAFENDETTGEPTYRFGPSGWETYYHFDLPWFCTINKDDFRNPDLANKRRFKPDRVFDPMTVNLLSKIGKRQHNYTTSKSTYLIVPNAEQIMRDDATETTNDIRDMFVVKNLKKVVSVLEGKGDANFGKVAAVSSFVNMSGLEGEFQFTFKDGSRFNVNNSVVFVVNSFGTRFYRFPLRFYDVIMPNGKRMPTPSEKRMNTVFLGK